MRERLRGEKELLGLYLSEHPMGEVADQVGAFVTAYSGDLKSDETLDGKRLVIGVIVVGARTVVTRARATMAVVTLEDLQGSIEVVVFPRLYEQTGPTWAEGSILLVAGRVDHRGGGVSLPARPGARLRHRRGQRCPERERSPLGAGFAPARSAGRRAARGEGRRAAGPS